MCDITHKTCEYLECDKRANFNIKGETTARFCIEHKEPNMIDITYKKCNYPECPTRANFGFCGQSPTKCSSHKEALMFKNPMKKCTIENCSEPVCYGITEPVHCETHAIDTELCLIGSKCTKCFKIDILNKSKLCIYCEPNELFEQHKTYIKKRERLVLNYLDEHVKFPKDIEIKVRDDKIIDSTCNLYRPDRIYDCGTHLVITEIDEDQHKHRNFCDQYKSLEHAELARMYHIQAANGLPCIFFRFNPDKFKIKNKKINADMTKRLNLLVKWNQLAFTMVPTSETSPVRYMKLFYDEYNPNIVDFSTITEKDVLEYTVNKNM